MFRIETLGVRGSVPVSGEAYASFGSATSCIRVLVSNQEIYIDAGTGICTANPYPDTDITVFLTHPHLDHMIGMPFFSALSEKGRRIRLAARKRKGRDAGELFDGVFRAPYWPVGIFDFTSDISVFDAPDEFDLDDVNIRLMEGNHPGGVSIIRISYGGSVFVCATDVEPGDEDIDAMSAFCRDADLLLYDGQYTREEYHDFRGFGHSTPDVGAEIAKRANVKRLVITHHSPSHDDTFLKKMEIHLNKAFPESSFAHCGDVFDI